MSRTGDSLGLDPSIIRWQTSGAPGEQVFTIEWANAGFYEEIEDSMSTSFVNLQVRLFEADGAIEFHYGPSSLKTRRCSTRPSAVCS